MTTQTHNEPARQLWAWILEHPLSVNAESKIQLLDEALAAERRATVQRIRAAWKDSKQTESALLAILDEALATPSDKAAR